MDAHEALNSIWDETEADGRWKGVWIPKGGNQFIAQFTDTQNGATMSGHLVITINGHNVTIQRDNMGKPGHCTYTGTFNDHLNTAGGSYTCTMGGQTISSLWDAIIRPR
jgi:hypothetical protein